MYVKHAIVGALVGAVLLAGLLGWQLLQSAGTVQPVAQAESLTESAAPRYASAEELAETIASTGHCATFEPVLRLVNGESEAGECFIDGQKARISLYASRAEVGDVLDRSTGRDAYGMPLTVLAGENWIITINRGKDTEAAEKIAETLGGAVIGR